ncbi:MAG: 3-hydroxybutyryl-CoA dehydrogenase [Sphingobacteriaceae bacterium]|nr:3-hydroxybutyryl-CoA dehydrogenase [Sphingobacteriaceae bacterium]
MLLKDSVIGVIGCGAMGLGIAQVASTFGHSVIILDNNASAIQKAQQNLKAGLDKLVAKQKINENKAKEILNNISFTQEINELTVCVLVIEAVVENLEVKKKIFSQLESITKETCILASNTSSLAITAIAASCRKPERVIGIHFFNPATLMPLVEVIPGIASDDSHVQICKELISGWKKVCVQVKDTPGFIVNRVARPFYSEALRIYDEGIADLADIDRAMKEIGGFKMGPFELMDMIGHDVNYVVTETVWSQFYFDPKFKPSLTQKRLMEAGFFGRKSGKGFYNYNNDFELPASKISKNEASKIFIRILCMLINEAADTLYLKIASREDIDLAMTKGVNYPKGLLKWADEIGIQQVVNQLNELRDYYEEDRYRVCPLLKKMLAANQTFW